MSALPPGGPCFPEGFKSKTSQAARRLVDGPSGGIFEETAVFTGRD